MGTDLVRLEELKTKHKTVELSVVSDADLHLELLNAKRQAKFWTDKADSLKAKVAGMMGDAEVGLWNGEPIFTKIPIERLNMTDLKADYPDLYEVYLHKVEKNEFDEDTFKLARPDLWARYAVRPFKEVS